jgi:hypothetical protein
MNFLRVVTNQSAFLKKSINRKSFVTMAVHVRKLFYSIQFFLNCVLGCFIVMVVHVRRIYLEESLLVTDQNFV